MTGGSSEQIRENIYLIGFMGCGKSTVAFRLKKDHGMHLVEMDSQIEREAGMPISQIFAERGEMCFRNMETELLRQLAGRKDMVVSCGGGAAMREENVQLMKKSGRVVLLTASPETILERVSRSSHRPLLEGKKNVRDIAALMEQRRPAYEAAADLEVSTDGKTPDEICSEILENI